MPILRYIQAKYFLLEECIIEERLHLALCLQVKHSDIAIGVSYKNDRAIFSSKHTDARNHSKVWLVILIIQMARYLLELRVAE